VALTMIKGFSKNLAADICKFRPFRTIEEVKQIRLFSHVADQECCSQLSTGRHSVPNIGQKKAEKLKQFFYTHGEVSCGLHR
jgi:DNA uptake protein ComE-like DNA-binding protein